MFDKLLKLISGNDNPHSSIDSLITKEDLLKVRKDFRFAPEGGKPGVAYTIDDILNTLLHDESGQELLKSFSDKDMEVINSLWQLGGSPSVRTGQPTYKDKRATYTSNKNMLSLAKIKEGDPKSYLENPKLQGEGSGMMLFDRMLSELSHGLGKKNPSLMKSDEETVLNFLLEKTSPFTPPESPSDSAGVYEEFLNSMPKVKGEHRMDKYFTPGHEEHQTHSVIEPAVLEFLLQNIGYAGKNQPGYFPEGWGK